MNLESVKEGVEGGNFNNLHMKLKGVKEGVEVGGLPSFNLNEGSKGGLAPLVWGPHYWFVLQTIALTYPVHPTPAIRRKYYDFFQNLPLFIPDEEIQKRMIEWLDQYPITPYLKTRESLCRWVVFFHNKVNQYLGKEHLGYHEALDMYLDQYRMLPNQDKEVSISKQTIMAIFLCGLIGIIAIGSIQ